MNIYSFQDCLKIAEKNGRHKHLMLGNGFSIGIFPKIFNYAALADKINSVQTEKLFNDLQTNDFEYVLRMLHTTLIVINNFSDNESIKAQIQNSLNNIKETLIDVLTIAHPDNPLSITEKQYQSCCLFLKNFEDGKKYTFNYDLILYWVYMHFLEHENKDLRLNINDGFRRSTAGNVTWEIGNDFRQNLYYLHGALHLFSYGHEIEKFTWINNEESLKTQITDSLSSSKYPIFITEGSKEHKVERIISSAYLGRSFASLKAIQGNLFIYGHSLRDEDDHIFDLINSHKLENIFISIYGSRDSKENKNIINKVENWKNEYKNKNYHLFNAETAMVWNNEY